MWKCTTLLTVLLLKLSLTSCFVAAVGKRTSVLSRLREGRGSGISMAAAAAEKPAFTLYFSDMCPYAQRSVIAANELKLPYEPRPVQLGKENKEDWYKAINPLGKVPALVAGSDTVVESLVINEYLADAYADKQNGGSALMPGTPAGRAQVRVFTQRVSQMTDAYIGYLKNSDASKESELKDKLTAELKAVDSAIAASKGGYLVGDSLTLADIAYFPFLERAIPCLNAYKQYDVHSIGVPHLTEWFEKLSQRPTIKSTLKDPSTWVEVYGRYFNLSQQSAAAK